MDVSSLVVGGEALPVDVSEAQLERFRGVARQLEAEGLAVHRIPLLPGRDDYVFVSYGNAMLERRDGVLHVHMPSYGIPALDEAAIQAYEALGARVHPIRVDRVFRMGGSVGCLVAPLRRQAPVMGDGAQG